MGRQFRNAFEIIEDNVDCIWDITKRDALNVAARPRVSRGETGEHCGRLRKLLVYLCVCGWYVTVFCACVAGQKARYMGLLKKGREDSMELAL